MSQNALMPAQKWYIQISGLQSLIQLFFAHIRHGYHELDTGTSALDRGIGFSSEPAPLSARLRPVKEKWWLEVGRSSCFLSSEWLLLSPKRAKRPRFFCGCGLGSSFNPTSSNPSSGTAGWSVLSRCCCIEDRGVARERRTSRERRASMDLRASSDWRGYVSVVQSGIGDRAEISCATVSGVSGSSGNANVRMISGMSRSSRVRC